LAIVRLQFFYVAYTGNASLKHWIPELIFMTKQNGNDHVMKSYDIDFSNCMQFYVFLPIGYTDCVVINIF